MKANTSLGTVAALVALATSAQASGIIYSSITNQAITLDQGIDLNNDGTDDINFSNSSFFSLSIGDAGAGDILIATNDLAVTTLYSPGDTVAATDPNTSLADAENVLGAGISYIGFDLTDLVGTHTGWLEIDFSTTDPASGTLIAAAWDTAINHSITIPAPTPEPSVTVLAMLGGVVGFSLLRRVKSHDSLHR